MELTREMIATIAKQYKREQDYYYAGMKIDNLTGLLAEALLAEMDKPGVWDNAPEWAITATVVWYGKGGQARQDYTRELPKSRERQIAEELSCDTETYHPIINGIRAVDVIEKALLKYKAELEAGR